jgi:hypothetical protein
MKSWRAHRITKAIQGYDPELYARNGYGDRIDIFRKVYRYETYDLGEFRLTRSVEEPYRVFSLTDTWTPWGKPVEWGIEPILARLQASDLWKRDVGGDVISSNEKIKESQDRSRKNNLEAFLSDNRRVFAKAFDGINTSSLDKRTDRRYRDEKKLKI